MSLSQRGMRGFPRAMPGQRRAFDHQMEWPFAGRPRTTRASVRTDQRPLWGVWALLEGGRESPICIRGEFVYLGMGATEVDARRLDHMCKGGRTL